MVWSCPDFDGCSALVYASRPYKSDHLIQSKTRLSCMGMEEIRHAPHSAWRKSIERFLDRWCRYRRSDWKPQAQLITVCLPWSSTRGAGRLHAPCSLGVRSSALLNLLPPNGCIAVGRSHALLHYACRTCRDKVSSYRLCLTTSQAASES